ncbi:MAG: hypothetical protein E6J70_02575 [Deltaproteobacteria bacterium]|nr:MAG: hypothetical protein E6J70_02575 [Deltaproteobacteria bacterium]
MSEPRGAVRIVKVLLTITSLEFFGPILRDYSPSHAFNPTWVGHARVHLVWLLGFMFFSGLANLYLIWFRGRSSRPTRANAAPSHSTTPITA